MRRCSFILNEKETHNNTALHMLGEINLLACNAMLWGNIRENKFII